MSHREREVIGVDDRVSPARAIPLGIQHMMSMFGSTVLVPVLTLSLIHIFSHGVGRGHAGAPHRRRE